LVHGDTMNDASSFLPGFDPTYLKVLEIFHPYAFSKTLAAFMNRQRFVHYTTADTALRILTGREVWLRKSTCMNDFMEIEHGFECLQHAYKNNRDNWNKTLNAIYPDLGDELETRYNNWLPSFRGDTYLACVSEHLDDENRIGRLSMWRAYGGKAGVALVLNGFPLINPTDALGAYTSPVAYLNKERFEAEFQALIKSLSNNHDFIRQQSKESVLGQLFEVFRMATLCTKHPGFSEEKEWRIIYSPIYSNSNRIISSIESINGTPQKIHKIPLKDCPEENLIGIEIPQFLDSIIIGPSEFPGEIKEALASVLKDAGMDDAMSKIVVSDIPLRN